MGLDPGEFKKWVTASGVIATVNDGSLDLESMSYKMKICPGEKVEVPNTMLMLWNGDLKGLGKVLVGWSKDRDYLNDRGFSVVEQSNDGPNPWKAQQFKDWLKSSTMAKDLHGMFIWSHGYPGGISNLGLSIDYSEMSTSMNYKSALVIINACFSTTAKGDLNSPNGKFWGFPKVLVPIADSTSIFGVLKPGQQATKPVDYGD